MTPAAESIYRCDIWFELETGCVLFVMVGGIGLHKSQGFWQSGPGIIICFLDMANFKKLHIMMNYVFNNILIWIANQEKK